MIPKRCFHVAAILMTAAAAVALITAVTQPLTLRAQAQTAAGAKPGAERLPDLAVDPSVVAQQQEELKATCEEDARQQVSIDCPCMVEGYPEFRLERLSTAIRSTEKERDFKCNANPPLADCQQVQDRLTKLTSREGQIAFYPLDAGNRPGRKRRLNTSAFYVANLPKCKNSAALAQQIEQGCLDGALASPPAGKNAKDFCACVSGHYRKGFEAAEGAFSSNLDVSLKTEAYVACQK